MVFSTIIFLFRFLPITLALYYLAPAKLKNTVLFLCSLVFYCWGEVRFFPVMVALILINYLSGLAIEHFDAKPALRRFFLLVALIGSLGMLFYFKYANFVLRSANALLGTAFARPVIGKKLAEIALAEGADAICHGATGKGNDQVRFELAIKRFAPDMKIIAPWREWDIKSRDEEIDFAEAHHVPLKISRETNYSKDKNLWHLSHEGLDLEDPANEPNYEKPGFLEMGVSPLQAPDVPTYVTIDFEAGAPVAVDGEKMKASKIIEKLNQLGGANGIGIIDIVENRLVGMKDRGVYETPGGTILYFAHEQLEMLTVDKDTLHVKQKLAVDYADLIYNGKWYSPLQEALTAFANESNKYVTGSVKLKLYKGNIIPAGTTSPYSLYSENLVTFGESDYDQNQAAGFINLWGLPTKVQALREQGKL